MCICALTAYVVTHCCVKTATLHYSKYVYISHIQLVQSASVSLDFTMLHKLVFDVYLTSIYRETTTHIV